MKQFINIIISSKSEQFFFKEFLDTEMFYSFIIFELLEYELLNIFSRIFLIVGLFFSELYKLKLSNCSCLNIQLNSDKLFK